MRIALLTAAALASPLIVASSHAAPADVARPNILFILVDDLRWDDITCAGNPFVQSPHIDRLAKEGARLPIDR